MIYHKLMGRMLSGFIAVIMAVENPISVIAASDENAVMIDSTDLLSQDTYDDEIFEEPVSDESLEAVNGSEEEYYYSDEDEITEDIVSVNEASYENEDVDDEVTDEQTVSTNFTAVEIVSLRDENIKAYSMADHTVKVCYYSEPVNYKNDEGVWETIDNRLHFSYPDDFSDYYGYKNNASDVDVKFAAEANENRLFSMGDGDVSASFRYVKNADKGTNDIEESRNRKEESNAGEDETTGFQDDDIEPDKDDELEEDIPLGAGTGNRSGNANKTKAYRTVSDNDISWSSKIRLVSNAGNPDKNELSEPVLGGHGDGQDMTGDKDEPEDQIPDLPIPQTVWYENIEEDVSLKYEMLSSGVKESIVISSHDAPDFYCFDIDGNGQTLELTDSGCVIFKTGDVKSFVIPAPVVKDSAGVRDDGAYYELFDKGDGSYRLVFHISAEYLMDDSRVFPINADPSVEVYKKYKNMDGLGEFVCIGSNNTKSTQAFYVGRDKYKEKKDKLFDETISDGGESDYSGISQPEADYGDGKKTGAKYRTYFKPKLSYIPDGCAVTKAHMTLSSSNTVNGADFYYILPVTDKWNADRIRWNNQPIGDKNIKNKTEDAVDYAKNGREELDITAYIKSCIDGQTSYQGFCLLVEDEDKKGLKNINIPRSASEPFLTIEYSDFTGLEDYWSAHNISTGDAGQAVISDYTGSLTYVHDDAKTTGERMNIGISHVFNNVFAERAADKRWYTATDDEGNPCSSYGKGWSLSTEERLLIPAGEVDLEEYPYVYIDSDGTRHYFKSTRVRYYSDGKLKTAKKKGDYYPAARDEDGLGLFVVPVENKKLAETYPLKITDKAGTIVRYFDKNGYLGMVMDSNRMEKDYYENVAKQVNSISYERKPYRQYKTPESVSMDKIIEAVDALGSSGDKLFENAEGIITMISGKEVNDLFFSVSYYDALALQNAKKNIRNIIDKGDGSNLRSQQTKAIDELKKINEKSVYPCRLERVTDSTGNSDRTVKLNYNENNFLSSMNDPSQDDGRIEYVYDGCALTDINHKVGVYGKTSAISAGFEYNENMNLVSVKDDQGYKTEFGYGTSVGGVKYGGDRQVTSVREFGSKKGTPIAGQRIFIKYSEYQQTAFTFSGRNDRINTKDDIENVYCFDHKGRVTSVYSKKKLTGEVTGAVAGDYTEDDDEESEESQANKIKDSAVIGVTVTNLLNNSGFERKLTGDNGAWSLDKGEGYKISLSQENKYLGNRSGYVELKNPVIKSEAVGFSQTATVLYSGTYTASVYVKTKAKKDQKAHAILTLSAGGNTVSDDNIAVVSDIDGSDADIFEDDTEDEDDDPGDPAESVSDDELEETAEEDDDDEGSEDGTVDENSPSVLENGWTRVEAKIKARSGQEIMVNLKAWGDKGSEIWFDCAQLEKGVIANQYNLLPNSSFEGNTKSSKKAKVIPDGWSYARKKGSVDACLVTTKDLGGTTNRVPDGNKALCISGNEAEKKVLLVNPGFGSENASYTFSCYVKADCAPVRDDRKVGIRIKGDLTWFGDDLSKDERDYIASHIDEEDLPDFASADINTAVKGWQYVTMALPARNWEGKLIEIHFDHEYGTLCIDGCMLTRNEVKTATYTAGGRLRTSKSGERTTTYGIDARGRRKNEKSAGGANVRYKYDNETNDIEKITNVFTQNGNKKVQRTKYTYDDFGNTISENTISSAGKMISSSEYDEYGVRLVSETDNRGYKSRYSYYDGETGLLLDFTDAQNIKTTYEYDAYQNTTKIETADVPVSYEYDPQAHDRLKNIRLAGLNYRFLYNAYGNITKIAEKTDKTGIGTLVTYKYRKGNGKLLQKRYGNYNSIRYSYNSLEQLTAERYRDKKSGETKIVRYAYDNKGRIAQVRDGISEIRTRFTYDDAGRVVSAQEYDISGDEEQHYASFYDTYDKAGRQSSFTYVHGGDTLSYNYGYVSNDAPSKTRLPDGSIYKMIYDSLGRSKKTVFTPQKDGGKGKGRKIQTKISYLSTDAGLGDGNIYTTTLPEKVEVSVSGNVISSDLLAYDELNHVSKWNDTSYEYDSLGRLIKAEDGKNGNSYSYEYDDAGNILSSVDEKGTHTYEYDEKGLLSKYDGKIIGRYSGGNPGEYKDYNLTWTRGRVLDKAISDEHSIQYAYDHSGIRLAKTVDGIKTEYLVNGSTILSQKCGDDILRFYYSADGTLVEIGYINEASEKKIEMHFAVIKNAMGDVVALTTPEGTLVGSYEYDPYGRILSEKSTDADICGITQKNPFRYRSYYYDQDTGWYYLNSRYYDPEVKRFINADDADYKNICFVNIVQYNIFAYCNDDPINNTDTTGYDPIEDIMNQMFSEMFSAYKNYQLKDYLYYHFSWHYNRNMYNRLPEDPQDVIENWTEMSFVESSFHHMYSGAQKENLDFLNNHKYIHINDDGSSYEAVICIPQDGRECYYVMDNTNLGTYNYYSPINTREEYFSSRFMHFRYDVLPYLFLGN